MKTVINFEVYKKTWERLSKNKHFKYGAPFLAFIIGGSFALRYVTNIRFKYKPTVMMKEEASKMGIHIKSAEEVGDIEDHYKELQKLDIDNWENIRIPRPWEDGEGKEIV
ncbi:cytochrome c oxidase assembly protein COX16 homolog, mitochondrial [Chelonus insularis]|uniref:cytochrome c oxidase assembly protein COX16 homolog, mitochondrial n=1 Tax=Chelonus insularis TaxID=460826 RepID=UPI0015893CDC|nr:cytochrome c oxidase assembly protein COX16 homolog, mitochondrial [Chelonus insularis]